MALKSVFNSIGNIGHVYIKYIFKTVSVSFAWLSQQSM